MDIVAATAEMIAAMDGTLPARTTRCIAAVENGRVLGICGVYTQKQSLVMFASLTDELKRNKRAIIRGIQRIMRIAGDSAVPVYAMAQSDVPGSGRLLRHMGFEQVEGDLYRWAP